MRTLPRRPSRFKGLTVGLDVHKSFIQYVVLDAEGDEHSSGRFDAGRERLDAFVSALEQPAQFALEACSSFLWVHQRLAECVGLEQVHVAQPSRVRPIANSHEKNDHNDAWWLAYLLYEGRLPEAFVAQGELLELRIACRELRSETNRRADLIRRFRSHLLQSGIQMSGSSFHTKRSRDQARQITEQLPGVRSLACRQILEQIERIDGQVAYWLEKITLLCASIEEVHLLMNEMPGFGLICAATLWAELGDPRRYHSAKAYAKASGLTPAERSSGGRTIHGSISRAGSAHARWALTRAVIGAIRCKQQPGAAIRRWVLARKKRQPMRKVVVAGGRKLAEGVCRLFNWGECFDVAKGFGA